MDIQLREPKTEEEFRLYYDLRWRILREPWTQARDSARDEHERDAVHIMALEDGNLMGVGRLHFNSPEEAQVRYMAVEKGHARRGIGGLILEALELNARQRGAKTIVLNARESAIPFYARHSYVLVDKTSTLFESLVHWRMQKEL
jgi:N-acetylglutamate synthase-like GNAT family acetyltransferase